MAKVMENVTLPAAIIMVTAKVTENLTATAKVTETLIETKQKL